MWIVGRTEIRRCHGPVPVLLLTKQGAVVVSENINARSRRQQLLGLFLPARSDLNTADRIARKLQVLLCGRAERRPAFYTLVFIAFSSRTHDFSLSHRKRSGLIKNT